MCKRRVRLFPNFSRKVPRGWCIPYCNSFSENMRERDMSGWWRINQGGQIVPRVLTSKACFLQFQTCLSGKMRANPSSVCHAFFVPLLVLSCSCFEFDCTSCSRHPWKQAPYTNTTARWKDRRRRPSLWGEREGAFTYIVTYLGITRRSTHDLN